MIKIYENGQTFLEDNLTFLQEDKYASSLIMLNSKGIRETDKRTYLIKVEDDDKALIANRLAPYNVLLYGDYECLDELLSFLQDSEYELPGFMCSTEIGDHLKGYQKIIGMDFMEAYDKSEDSSENISRTTLDDVDELADLSQLFFDECGLSDKVDRVRIAERIDSYRVIRKDGKIISMARYCYNTESSSRISMVYTRKEYRGFGYAREVVNACKNEILAEGKVATLNVDQNNPISNHLYQSLGFKRVFSQGIYMARE